jgi:hypothetical protein
MHVVVISGSSKCHSIVGPVGHAVDAIVPGLPLDLEIKMFTVYSNYAAGMRPQT